MGGSGGREQKPGGIQKGQGTLDGDGDAHAPRHQHGGVGAHIAGEGNIQATAAVPEPVGHLAAYPGALECVDAACCK